MYCFSLFFKKWKSICSPCIHTFERMKAIRFFYACASRTERNMPSPLSSAPLPCAIVFMQTVLEKREALEGKTKRLEKNAALKRARCEKIKDPQTRACGSFFGAGSRGRTDMVSLPPDFESGASANSTIPAENAAAFATTRHIIPHSCEKIKGFSKKSEKNPKWV